MQKNKKKPSLLKSLPDLPIDFDLDALAVFGTSRRGSKSDRAQDLVYEAWEHTRKEDRVRLAKKALSIDPDCVDALVLLASESAKAPSEKLLLLKTAVAAGEKSLGKETFERDAGHFWGLLETRPYMRARGMLAQALWKEGRAQDAISHMEELLRLNPNDNQGNRYILLSWYFQADLTEKARSLMESYSDECLADWSYARFLLMYQSGRGKEELEEAVRKALESNSWIPEYLRGEMRVPKRLPDAMALGSREEAIVYASNWEPVWKANISALDRFSEIERDLLSSAQLPPGLEAALGKCAWCRTVIQKDQEVFGLAAQVRSDFDLEPWRGAVLPVAGPEGNEIVCIVANKDSEASRAGQDLQFMVCSLECVEELRLFLEDEVEFVTRVFPEF